MVLADRDFDDLVTTIHLVSETIYEHGFADRILAAVFKFHAAGRDVYWIYNYKRGAFHPLVPSDHQPRDNASEMRMGALMQEERIPVERSLEHWYSLPGIPF